MFSKDQESLRVRHKQQDSVDHTQISVDRDLSAQRLEVSPSTLVQHINSNSSHNVVKLTGKAQEEVKPTSEFSLLNCFEGSFKGELMMDEDLQKLERMQLINASARFELISANQ